MSDTLYKKLRIEHGYGTDHLAAKLDTTADEYNNIELGVVKPTFQQAGLLGELYNIDPKHLLGIAESVNYNIGRFSRTIYAVNYYEKSEENPENDPTE